MMSSGEAAQQAKQAAMQTNYDAKKFPCGPWLDGARGGPWIHVFKPAFENAMRERTDQFSSLYEHFISETAYGARRGPAHPQGNGLASLNISSIASYRTRDEKAYAYILLVIGYPTYVIAAGRPNAGQPDLRALVKAFQELWEIKFDEGIEIKTQAAPRAAPEKSVRLDGMSNAIVESNSADDYDWVLSPGFTAADLHDAYSSQTANAYIVKAGGEAFAFLEPGSTRDHDWITQARTRLVPNLFRRSHCK